MSCVADEKPMIQKNATESGRYAGSLSAKARSENATTIVASMASTNVFLVRKSSTSGAHSGLITHGRYMAPVYVAISVFDSPRFLYMMAATTETAIMGVPIAK
jgi:hypothetical protein